MGVHNNLIHGLNRALELAGTPIAIEYFTDTIGSVWDDEVTYAQSGNTLWTSGVVFPLNTREGSSDSVLLNQGKLIESDKKLYTNGSLTFTGSINSVTIQLGSPTGDLYTSIPEGGIVWEAEASPVYKTSFIRRLTGSTLDG